MGVLTNSVGSRFGDQQHPGERCSPDAAAISRKSVFVAPKADLCSDHVCGSGGINAAASTPMVPHSRPWPRGGIGAWAVDGQLGARNPQHVDSGDGDPWEYCREVPTLSTRWQSRNHLVGSRQATDWEVELETIQ